MDKFGKEETIHIDYRLMKLQVPKDIKNLDNFYFYYKSFRKQNNFSGRIFDISDIDMNKAGRRVFVENLISKAIEENNFQIYYQQIFSLKENKFTSAEALIRLIDPECGFIPPDEFIPIAEANGTILEIGDIVFKKTFEFIKNSNLKQMGIEYIEINLSTI